MTSAELETWLTDPVAYPLAKSGVVPFAAANVGLGWSIVIGDQNIGPQYELTGATQRAMAFHISESGTFTFQLDGNDPALEFIKELVTDVWAFRNGVLVFRGRIGSTTDTLDGQADTYTVAINCFDYREWLGRQVLQPSRKWSWRTVTQAKILNDMFAWCINGQTGLHPTFTVDTTQMPTSTVNYDVTAGTSMKEAIGVMSGFGWQVYPNSLKGITLKAISPWYYAINNEFVLEYGGTVDQITRSLDTAGYANSSVYTGDMKLPPIQSDAAGISTMPQGRLASIGSNPAIVTTKQLQQAAASDASRSQNVVPSWSCHLTPGTWLSPADAWLGDICRFYVWRNRLKVNDRYRITDIEVKIDDDSNRADDVTITVAKPPYIPSS